MAQPLTDHQERDHDGEKTATPAGAASAVEKAPKPAGAGLAEGKAPKPAGAASAAKGAVDPAFARAENEDDDGYDPWSDRLPDPEPLFERDPWS